MQKDLRHQFEGEKGAILEIFLTNNYLRKTAIVRAYNDVGFEGYVRPDNGRMIWGEKGDPGSASTTAHEPSTPGWQFAVASGILGWVLDTFDFLSSCSCSMICQ